MTKANSFSKLSQFCNLPNRCTSFALFLFFCIIVPLHTTQAGTVSGNLQKWAPLTIDFNGPSANETDSSPNPFLDYRLNVTLTAPSGNTYLVPGFFAGNGQGGGSGNHWQIRFAADEVGTWNYSAQFRSGQNVALNTNVNAGNAASIADPIGQFTVSQQSPDAPGFLRYGRLDYTGEHYLKFRDGPYWLKAGTDSPENFLGYAGIDGTVNQGGLDFLHNFATHRADARDDDPLFSNASTGVDSRGITGALNYLADQGVNSIYFLPMNLGGDGQETYPFVGGQNTVFNKTHYDISKLFQWNQVLNHAQRRGIALNIQLSETERANERWLDNGQLGTERMLFFRELVARFGYLLAAKWNLGEENDFPVSELRQHAAYIDQLDWTEKPIAVHTQINDFRDYEQIVGDPLFSASSIQYDPPLADEFVETWRERSAATGHKWVIDMDENTGGVGNTNGPIRRKQILYDVFFSGGNLEWYFGLQNLPLGGDTTAEDFRTREDTWTFMRYASEFINSELPFWRMEPADNLVIGESNSFGGAEVFSAANEIYAIYLPQATGNPTIDLRNTSGSFSQRWFNPRNGQFAGGTSNIIGGQVTALGSPPSSSNEDWVVLIKSHNAPALPEFSLGGVDSLSDTNSTADQSSIDAPTETVDESSGEPIDDPSDDALSGTADNDVLSDNDALNEVNNNDENTATNDGATNEPPAFITPDAIPAAQAGDQYTLTIIATDPNGIAPIVSATDLPQGMFIESVISGAINIAWNVPADASGTVVFVLFATDVANSELVVSQSVSVEVIPSTGTTDSDSVDGDNIDQQTGDNPPDNADNADQPINDETTVSGENSGDSQEQNSVDVAVEFAASTDLAPSIVGAENSQLVVGRTFQKTITPIDPEGIVASLRIANLPANSMFVDNGDGSREFIWTPTENDIGEHNVRIVATDSGSTAHVVEQTVTLTVFNESTDGALELNIQSATSNRAPLFFPFRPMQVTAGETIMFRVNPIDPDGVPPILHVDSPPAGASFSDTGNGSRIFSWQPTDDNVGTIQLTFIATDNDDLSVTVQQSVSIEVLAN